MEDRIESVEVNAWRRLSTLSRHCLAQCESSAVLNLLHFQTSASAYDSKLVISESVVIGGMVLDIHATPAMATHRGSTTPGKVHYVHGGVARNVAECMSKLGTKPFMISVIGVDMAGNLLLEHWKSAGLVTEGIRRCQDVGTPTVINMFDFNGEVVAGVASTEAIEIFLNPEWVRRFRCNICSSPAVMVDANLSPSALLSSCQIAAEFGIPVWFEPVSVAKSRRLASIAKYVTFTSPNEDELVSMANALSAGNVFSPVQRVDDAGRRLPIESLFRMLKPAITLLLEKGVKIIIVTLGADGVFICCKDGPGFIKDHLKNTKSNSSGRQLYEIVTLYCAPDKFDGAVDFKRGVPHLFAVHFSVLPASVVKLTGAGDCLVGGTLSSLCAGLDLMQSIAVGMAAAKTAVEGSTNVPSEFNLGIIADAARRIYDTATIICDEPLA
ncbi:hypothetical protein Sjap_016871 [Stephania japonica]|uniref:Carbohydrate kinase PfkB domain-containing protein n=1 Tax=Stephania japonica TaxID=461633 RepID=A0AAP0I561_9MAGN